MPSACFNVSLKLSTVRLLLYISRTFPVSMVTTNYQALAFITLSAQLSSLVHYEQDPLLHLLSSYSGSGKKKYSNKGSWLIVERGWDEANILVVKIVFTMRAKFSS